MHIGEFKQTGARAQTDRQRAHTRARCERILIIVTVVVVITTIVTIGIVVVGNAAHF